MDEPAPAADAVPEPGTEPVGERRSPVLIAAAFTIALPLLMPSGFTVAGRWVVAALEVVLLVAFAISDPGRIDRRSAGVRKVRLALIILIVGTAAFAVVRLTDSLIHGSPETNDANALLRAGALVWIFQILAFAFLYWELDSGGPGNRAHTHVRHPDLAFPQQLSPELAPDGWKPVFYDYLYLGLTNAIAFSPTDAMPLSRWAKLVMAIQSLSSVVVLSLVIARAVNILT